MHVALAGFGLKSLLIRHDEIAKMVHHGGEHGGENDTVTQQCLLPLCPRRCHLFASSHWHIDIGCGLEAIDTTIGCVMQQGPKEGHTVGLYCERKCPLFLLSEENHASKIAVE